MKRIRNFAAVALLCWGGTPALAATDASFDNELLSIQQAWAQVYYDIAPGDEQKKAFEALEKRAEAFTQRHPDRAEALIWEGIIESTWAGAKGGLGALSLAKEARGNLEAALKIDPRALDGSAYASLGTLYYKVPGFPLGFGDDDKAEVLFRKALAISPDSIDTNYLYGEFLASQGKLDESLQHLQRAARAAPRPGRARADSGRQAEIATLVAQVERKRG
jgi:tetratricopeptide (TPR) repeat protein